MVNVHPIGHKHRRGNTHGGDIHAEQRTHGATYIRRDIHTEGHTYERDMHMTLRGHKHGRDIYT